MGEGANGDMVVLARKSRGLTQGELASQTGISQGQLSRYESRDNAILGAHLTRIAEILCYPESFFYQTMEPVGLGPSILYHRKKSALGQKKLQQIEATVNVLSGQLCTLLAKCQVKNEFTFPRYSVGDFQHNPREVAQAVRAQWHLPIGPVRNIVRVIENAGGVVMKCNFGTRDLDGFGVWGQSFGPFFFVNRDIPTDRLRFTLVHEMGHIIMHHGDLHPDIEYQADAFASEFLMPAEDIKDELQLFSLEKAARLKLEWRVSMAALVRRARDLGAISESQYTRFCKQLSMLGYRTREPIVLSEEKPSLLKKIVEVLGKEARLSYKEMAEMTHSSFSDFLANYLEAPSVNLV